MRTMKDMKKRFLVTTGCFSLISVSLLLLPFGTSNNGKELTVPGILVGVLFWFGILSGCLSYILMYRKYRERLLERFPKSRLPGCLRIFSNPAAVVVDLIFILSAVVSIYCSIQINTNRILEFISLFLCITSFYLHFLVTGRVFRYIEQIEERKKGKHERKTKTKREADSLRTDLCDGSRDDH